MNFSRTIIQSLCVALMCTATLSARANFIGLQLEYSNDFTMLELTVIYDFTDFAMFGGGANLIYDDSALEFVSYEQATLPVDAQAPASPIGALEHPGLYVGLGIGTFDFFSGITSAGAIGTFYFNIIDFSPPEFTSCGGSQDPYSDPILSFACLTPNPINPLVSLAGDDVTVPLFLAGDGTYIPPVPLPAALWLFLGGFGALVGLRKRHA